MRIVSLSSRVGLSLYLTRTSDAQQWTSHNTTVVFPYLRFTCATRFNVLNCRRRARTCPPKVTGGGRARSHVSRSTRPNVAGADGGVNRWRRKQRSWRPRKLNGRPLMHRSWCVRACFSYAYYRNNARVLFSPTRICTTESEYTHYRHTDAQRHIYTRAEKPRGYGWVGSCDNYTPPNL